MATPKPVNHSVTVSFSENAKGWPSFKSFIHEDGLSLNNTYYTFFGGQLYEHHLNPLRNNYYSASGLVPNGGQFDSHVDVLFNNVSGSVKSFQTLNYEGTQARVTPDIDNNVDYYDNFLKTGWYVRKILTVLHQGSFSTYGNWVDQDEFLDDRIDEQLNTGIEFWDKEGKWFAQIKGVATEWLPNGKAGNIDTQEFSYQGIGNASDINIITPPGPTPSWDCTQVSTYSWGCSGHVGPGLGAYLSLAACAAACTGPPIASWDCINGSCIDPGTGNGTFTSLSACQSICSPTSWDCDPFGNCYDPGTGNGQYPTLAACTAVCACAQLIGPNGPDYFLTVQDDTGACTSPNNDGSVTWSLTIPNFTAGDIVTHQIKTAAGGQVNNPTTVNTANIGGTVTSLPPDTYHLYIFHASGISSPYFGGTCHSTIVFTVGCSGVVTPSWNCSGQFGVGLTGGTTISPWTCYDPGTGTGNYATQALCEDFCDTWDCIQTSGTTSGSCINPGNGLGFYGSLADCQNLITGCPSQRWACCIVGNTNYDPTCATDPNCTCDTNLCAISTNDISWWGCDNPVANAPSSNPGSFLYLGPNGLICAADPYCSPDPTLCAFASSCFVAGTKITMENGSHKYIEDIKVGDIVKSWNENTGDINDNKVTKLKQLTQSDMVVFNFDDIEIKNTFAHPYYVEGKGWCSYRPELTITKHGLEKVKQLEVNDVCYRYNGNILDKVTLTKIKEDLGETQTYIFEVEKDNTFFADNILVHNK